MPVLIISLVVRKISRVSRKKIFFTSYKYSSITTIILFVVQFCFYHCTNSIHNSLSIAYLSLYSIQLNLLVNHGVFFEILCCKPPVAARYYGSGAGSRQSRHLCPSSCQLRPERRSFRNQNFDGLFVFRYETRL